MHPVDDRCDTASFHGGNSVRQAIPAQEEDADVIVLEERGHLSEGRPALPHVSSR